MHFLTESHLPVSSNFESCLWVRPDRYFDSHMWELWSIKRLVSENSGYVGRTFMEAGNTRVVRQMDTRIPCRTIYFNSINQMFPVVSAYS